MAQVDNCRRVCEAVAGGELDVAIVVGDIPDELSETLDAVPYAEVRRLLDTALLLRVNAWLAGIEAVSALCLLW